MVLPGWADEMRQLYRSGSNSQFILYGNVFDLVEAPRDGDSQSYLSLRTFLTEVMFSPFDVIIHYDRGHGIRVRKGGDLFHQFLKAFDAFRKTSWAALPDTGPDKMTNLNLGNLLPRDATQALELINRFLRGSQQRVRSNPDGSLKSDPLRVAVIIDYVHFIAPRGEPVYLSGDRSQNLIQLLEWASDPTITSGSVATVLISENLSSLNKMLVENPYSAKVKLNLPDSSEIGRYVKDLAARHRDFSEHCELTVEELADKLVGLSRVNVRGLILRAISSSMPLTRKRIANVKKELIEKEAFGRIEFVESDRTLDQVAGHIEAKAWFRQDAELLRKGRLRAIPMGYLLCGRIGTGKTFLVECLAGEVGIPVVEIKNFREKWVGSTEGNLEKVFNILHALGQVIVFIDEADQMTGQRGGDGGDSGLSGRIYGMLAKEMSDTHNRGKIIWIFATSRPDLLEVDLKRQGRLDVHIPLFPPQDPHSRQSLFAAMARKVGLDLDPTELPPLPDKQQLGGNEMEGILVRSLRLYETQAPGFTPRPLPEIIAGVIAEFRPSAHVDRLEMMDLLAVKECTDSRFLPARFKTLTLSAINRRLEELKALLTE